MLADCLLATAAGRKADFVRPPLPPSTPGEALWCWERFELLLWVAAAGLLVLGCQVPASQLRHE